MAPSVYGGYGPKPSPVYGPGYSAPPTYSTYPPPPTYGGKSPVAPYCTTITGCLTVNASSGGALDAFNLTAANWVAASPSAVKGAAGLLYEFGVATPLGMSGNFGYTPYRPYSPAPSFVIQGLPVGLVDLYVCVRSAGAATPNQPVGPRGCASLRINVTSEVSERQVMDQLSAIAAFTSVINSPNASTASIAAIVVAVEVSQRLAAVAALTNSSSFVGNSGNSSMNAMYNSSRASIPGLATGLLQDVVDLSAAAAGGPSAAAATTATLAAFGAMDTLWPLASDTGRNLVVSRVSVITAPLASQQVAPEDAEHVVGLLTTILTDGPDLVIATVSAYAASSGGNGTTASGNSTSGGSSSTNGGDGNMGNMGNGTGNGNGNGNGNQMQGLSEAANALLVAVSDSSASLTRGLLNGAPADGTPVRFATAKLTAAVQRATAALAAAGVTVSVAAATVSVNQGSGRHRHSRHLIASTSTGDYAANAQVSASLNPAVGGLCSSDPTCASAGLGVALTVLPDPSLLLTALGGSAAALAANMSDYTPGSSVQLVSPIVRVTAPGLPSTAFSLASLLYLDLPVNASAVAAGGSTAKRALVRLQDFNVATADASVGVSASRSTTVTSNSTTAAAERVVSGYSNTLGDFVVIQYNSNGVGQSGSGGAAGQSLPSALLALTSAVGAVVLGALLL
ncbi:hypothetical protein HXX76_014667 [Chlamydomonas incerta]|uniref:Uncharacterized protein n=1 Tax=Chlamydomonas incerta TaxID=51695 RepID=A0A835VSW5_CHLIN|nr:hypothetical protein HXX76_014667 [Chlamydomonas incerta]|eukprot:KAG2424289.1 hypothetical protein HXX76_014667 [Chlamydomonas incerta]